MKLTLVAFILVGSLHIIFAHSNPKKFQDVNVDIVLGNDRVLTNYIMCLLDQKPCSREGLELKSKFDHQIIDFVKFSINLLQKSYCFDRKYL